MTLPLAVATRGLIGLAPSSLSIASAGLLAALSGDGARTNRIGGGSSRRRTLTRVIWPEDRPQLVMPFAEPVATEPIRFEKRAKAPASVVQASPAAKVRDASDDLAIALLLLAT